MSSENKEGSRALFAIVAGLAVSVAFASLCAYLETAIVDRDCSDPIKDAEAICAGSTKSGVFIGVVGTLGALVGSYIVGGSIYKAIK